MENMEFRIQEPEFEGEDSGFRLLNSECCEEKRCLTKLKNK